VPDWPWRLWGTGAHSDEDYTLQPTQSYAEFITKLVREYLGAILLWDPNAGVNGMWRLKANPAPPYGSPIAAFTTTPPSGKLPHYEGSYAAATTFIEKGTFRSFVRPPECNYVLVVGAGGSTAPGQINAYMYNPVSVDLFGATANPAHPDYINGSLVPVVHVDPSLTTREACAIICRRLYDRLAHAETWAQWRSPLLLITEPGDAYQTRVRPVRIGDVVTLAVQGVSYTALIRNCNPSYVKDSCHMAEYESLVV
jgi:hypothetical protein